jgi:hypothetical protein
MRNERLSYEEWRSKRGPASLVYRLHVTLAL